MKIEGLICQAEVGMCEVCDKRLAKNETFAHLEREGETAAICSPSCFAILQREPRPFIARLRARRVLREKQCASAYRHSA